MKLCRSELAANDVIRRYCVLRPFVLLPLFPILRHSDAFVTNFTTAEFPGKPKAANSKDIHYPETSTTDNKDERTEINRPWQNDHIQTKRKAELSPELANRSNKLTKTTYAVTTHNRFQDLETENNEGPPEQHKEPKPPKPEPILSQGFRHKEVKRASVFDYGQ
ncbi:hypothetical protein EVAR_12941_1 [Eumeta japonica]|uniref:Uncharacterized protein n=1 Tax=Eumeta variegata TaxID=151549 RepID=A0A4C1TW66_EUMVA|nr:hypothetical protein EVAR_12941_1 [Eumeta japonica]